MNVKRRTDEIIRDALRDIRAHILGMWRFRWLALAVAWLACIAGCWVVYSMPNVYSANARVFVDTENAIQDFLRGIAAPSDVLSEVNLVVREMVSRPNLAEVARNTDLALRTNSPAEFEQLLTALGQRISVSGGRDGVFNISFADSDRETALAVVDNLLTTFVEKSLGDDRNDSAQAQQFLVDQIAEYERRLTEAENRLALFKRDNVDTMPDQQGDYFSRMQAAERALESTEGKLNLAVNMRDELLRQIEGEEPVFGMVAESTTGESATGPNSAKIRELELQLAELRLQYTDRHPRIGQILETIELLKNQEAQERRARAESAARAPLQQNPLDLNPVYQNMRIQLSNVEVEIASLRAERTQQGRDVARLRELVDTIPQVEAELNRLNRDYDVVQTKHQQLLQQLETANLGEDASRSIDEVQFRIIDPPFSGLAPVGPNRALFLMIVAVFGVGLGVSAAFVANQLKPTFVGNRSITEVLGIPVLASVSLLQTREEARAEKMGLVRFQVASVLFMVSCAAAIQFSDVGATFLQDVVQGLN
ncbi:MAG: XrtA system polysaccharide chain length determinant [Pseudomonadota bacterium]